jgi:glutamate 5-kinase
VSGASHIHTETSVDDEARDDEARREGAASQPLPYRRIVVKAGTSVLTAGPDHQSLDLTVMAALARQISQLRSLSAEVLLVSSGAIAAGQEGRSDSRAASDIPSRQVRAAIGQSRLMHTYQELFGAHDLQVAQVLLTIKDLYDRQSYLNVRTTLQGLWDLGVVPILNENDVVAVDEIGEVFGDNDRLSALVANLVDADLLVILTDIDGLYTADPNLDSNARLIPSVERVDEDIEALAGRDYNPWARGGMTTKIEAARLVTTSGITMIMCHGTTEDAVLKAARGDEIGTVFRPAAEKLEARKRWMLGAVSQRSSVAVDKGAAAALQKNNGSLLPAGITDVTGGFERGDIVYIIAAGQRRIACGIANYGSADIKRIKGFRSDDIQGTLGYHYGPEVIHRDNLVLI